MGFGIFTQPLRWGYSGRSLVGASRLSHSYPISNTVLGHYPLLECLLQTFEIFSPAANPATQAGNLRVASPCAILLGRYRHRERAKTVPSGLVNKHRAQSLARITLIAPHWGAYFGANRANRANFGSKQTGQERIGLRTAFENHTDEGRVTESRTN